MSDPQSTVDASKLVAQAIGDYGLESDEAVGAMDAALGAAEQARANGYTADDIRNG
ncbi:hypothetical protein GPA10_24920 [Streptomyces sp. p1417]|uniref:Uncharacterized protein n=1 Tax=Streptomyces typhae TaxID=2681492 RepID=A0A6L6X2B8_9ACTN|nr:hypothetical protein [Streptomyces typhae]MVO87911.1 hypothetical protein [Streptomyces typhae]